MCGGVRGVPAIYGAIEMTALLLIVIIIINPWRRSVTAEV